MTQPRDDLFDRALTAADIELVAGTPLFRQGRRLRGECPLCGASKGKRSGGAFSADPQAKVFKCFGCDEGGDVIQLEHLLRSRGGETLRDAAKRLTGDVDFDPHRQTRRPEEHAQRRRQVDAEAERSAAWKAGLAADLWRQARPAAGSPVETYLRRRLVRGRPLAEALKHLRFHPAAYHHGPSRSPVTAPAMVALPRTPEGPTGGVHVTYLAAGGLGKAELDPSKIMWGPQARGGAPGGVWLTHPGSEGPLIVAEGIESGLSAAVLHGAPCRVVATLALRSLQGGVLKDRWKRFDPDMPSADPEAPAFTWPEPDGAPWGQVLVAVDQDMSPVKVRTRKALGGTYQRTLGPAERAALCGALAGQAWRRAGAHAVRIVGPGPGRDFNDELRARIAAGELAA